MAPRTSSGPAGLWQPEASRITTPDGRFGYPLAEIELREGRPEEPVWLLVACSPSDGLLCRAIRTRAGHRVLHPPKGWSVERHPDHARRTPERHWHVEKDGEKYAIRQDASGSHETRSGTVLPRRVGEWLHEQAGVPLRKEGGLYIVRLLPLWTWDEPMQARALEIAVGALNADICDLSVASVREVASEREADPGKPK